MFLEDVGVPTSELHRNAPKVSQGKQRNYDQWLFLVLLKGGR